MSSALRIANWSIGKARGAFSRFNSLAKKYPFAASAVFMGARYIAGDAIVQHSSGRWDQRRSTTFLVFGLATGWIWGRVINEIYPFVFRSLALKSRLWMIVGEAVWHVPFIFYPLFYLTQDFIETNKFSISRAWNLYVKNIKADWIAWAKFWPASMFLAIVLLPNHLVPLFIAAVGLQWVVILSRMRGTLPEDQTSVHSDNEVSCDLVNRDGVLQEAGSNTLLDSGVHQVWPISMLISIVLLPRYIFHALSALFGLLWNIMLSKMKGTVPADQTSCENSEERLKIELANEDGVLADLPISDRLMLNYIWFLNTARTTFAVI